MLTKHDSEICKRLECKWTEFQLIDDENITNLNIKSLRQQVGQYMRRGRLVRIIRMRRPF